MTADAAAHAGRQIAADSGRAISARQLAANGGKAADGVSLLQPGRAENGTAWNRTLAGSVAGAAPVELTSGAGRGTVAQDARSAQSAATLESIAMAWILLEALVALLLAVFIVWFTIGGSRKPPPSLPPALPTSAPPSTDDESGEDTRNK